MFMSMPKFNSVYYKIAPLLSVIFIYGSCATQTPAVYKMEAPHSSASQRAAQETELSRVPDKPVLKRKIALGRITNETKYGQSLLRDAKDDPLGKQVTDLLSKALTESGAFLVFERPDFSRVVDESRLSGANLNKIGVDALIIGSLTEFGRKTLGESGFVSSTKKQVAFAKLDVRVVDTTNGHIFFSASGAGEASTESGSVFGFGSQASYDGTLNDAAIRQAVSDLVDRLSNQMSAMPWRTYILEIDSGLVYIGGGKSQGILPGMEFAVMTRGRRVVSPQPVAR